MELGTTRNNRRWTKRHNRPTEITERGEKIKFLYDQDLNEAI